MNGAFDDMIGSPDAAWLDSFLDEPSAACDFDMDFFLDGEGKAAPGEGVDLVGLPLEEEADAEGAPLALAPLPAASPLETQKRKIKKKRDRERRAAVDRRKRKRVQMETLLHTTRQLQLQNAQLLRTLGAVQQMAQANDLEGAARVAAAAGKAAELLAAPSADASCDPDAAAGGGSAIAQLFLGAEGDGRGGGEAAAGGTAAEKHERLMEQRARVREERITNERCADPVHCSRRVDEPAGGGYRLHPEEAGRAA